LYFAPSFFFFIFSQTSFSLVSLIFLFLFQGNGGKAFKKRSFENKKDKTARFSSDSSTLDFDITRASLEERLSDPTETDNLKVIPILSDAFFFPPLLSFLHFYPQNLHLIFLTSINIFLSQSLAPLKSVLSRYVSNPKLREGIKQTLIKSLFTAERPAETVSMKYDENFILFDDEDDRAVVSEVISSNEPSPFPPRLRFSF